MGKNLNILILGYYGFGNLGDELILSIIIRELKARHPGAIIKVLSHEPVETKLIQGVVSVSRWNPLTLLWNMISCDLFILGGGGLFQDSTSFKSLLYYLFLLGLAELFNKRIFLPALGVESIQSSLLRFLSRLILLRKKVSISVRDENSKKILCEIGLKNKIINVTADPVFLYEPTSRKPRRSGPHPKVLLIPRFPSPSGGHEIYRILIDLLSQKGISYAFTLFQPSVEFVLWKGSSFPIINETNFVLGNTLKDQADLIWDFDMVISSRLHGLILSGIAGNPFLGIGDRNKIGQFCLNWGMPYLAWVSDQALIRKEFERLFSIKPSITSGRLVEIKEKARATFSVVN